MKNKALMRKNSLPLKAARFKDTLSCKKHIEGNEKWLYNGLKVKKNWYRIHDVKFYFIIFLQNLLSIIITHISKEIFS